MEHSRELSGNALERWSQQWLQKLDIEDKRLKQSLETPSTDDIQLGYSTTKQNDGKLANWLKILSIETGGIERVTDEELAKNTSKVWHACTFWYV
jgi:hypothetical protein